MLYHALVAESRRDDSLDDVRSAALDRARRLVDLLERQRTDPRWDVPAVLRGPGALVVRGDVGTYKIHLGSANILMEPDDAYLCIVPAGRKGDGKVFLPFEDERLSLILSKAFLLAADTRITDVTILRQIKRGA
ncbi:hypothetical protein [Streptomyces sp. NPDC008240]|uniref:DUF7737 domain-containing protein n=1 Tax=Streptomyces sp. NPDC008240 TaxID=3364822 RepID=UPI0036E429F9